MGFFDDVVGANLQGTLFRPPQGRTDKPSILDRVLGLYGSDPNTHIPGARNEALRSGLQTGAAAILQSQLAGQNPSAFQQLAMAGMGLQQGGANVAQQRQQAELQAMLKSGSASPAQLQLMGQQALAMGDYKTAQIIQQMLQAQASMESARQAGVGSKARGLVTQAPAEDGTMHNVLLDPTSGAILKDLGPVQADKGVVVDGTDAEGNPIKMLVNPRTGERIRTYDQPKKPPTIQEEKLATDATLVTNAVADVESALERLGRGPNFVEYEMYKHDATRAGVSNDVQALLQAQEALVSILARVVTGSVRAAASPEIRDAINRSFLVAPGDSPMNREQTLRNLRIIRDRLKTEAGRAWLRQEAGITEDMLSEYRDGEGADIADGVGPQQPVYDDPIDDPDFEPIF